MTGVPSSSTEHLNFDPTSTSMKKTCSKCGIAKPLGEFPANKGMRDGYENQCKACRTLAAKQRRHASMKAVAGDKNRPLSPRRKTKTPETKASEAPQKEPPRLPEIKTKTDQLVLNLTNYPEIRPGLEEMAQKSIRPIEYQALLLVRMGLMMDGYLPENREIRELD